jgi:hypothetical protein
MREALIGAAICLGCCVGIPVAWAVIFGSAEALSLRRQKPRPSRPAAIYGGRGPIADRLHFLGLLLGAFSRR